MSYNQNEGQIYSFSIQVFFSFLSFPSIFNFPPFRIHNLKPYGYGTTPLLVWHLLVLERLFLAPWFMSASFSFTAGSNSGEQLQLKAKWKRITILTILPWVLNIFFSYACPTCPRRSAGAVGNLKAVKVLWLHQLSCRTMPRIRGHYWLNSG